MDSNTKMTAAPDRNCCVEEQMAVRDGEIAQAHGELSRQTQVLLDLAKRAYERLQPILTQEPTKENENGTTRGYSCDLANAINTQSAKVAIANSVLENILSRIEL